MNEQRFDHLWHNALANHASLVKHANGMRTAARLFRRAAYRFATDLIAINKKFPNELVAHCETMKCNFDEWMDEHFEPVESMGQNRRQLFGDIESGMTEKEYIAQFTMWGVKKRATATCDTVTRADLTAKPDNPSLTWEERFKGLAIHTEAVVSESRIIRRDLATAVARIKQYELDMARLERVVDRMTQHRNQNNA